MGRLLALFIFKIFGWRTSTPPVNDFSRCVMIAAPHTSNWDIIFARAAFSLLRIPVRFTVKDDWMKFPYGGIMRAFGGIGINRRPKSPGEARPGMTQSMIDLFSQNKELAIMVTPEGTRALRTTWKSGFYHVAIGAKVPIGLGYLDYKNKIAGVGKILYPSGDIEKDMKIIMDFYKNIQGKFPEKFSIDTNYV